MKSHWLIRLLLRLYPAEFRERYGAAMLDFHRERVGAGTGLLAWPRVIADHVHSAAAEHIRRVRAEQMQTGNGANMATVLQDVRYAVRALARRRVFAIVVIATIALGVGANTAIFSVVHAIVLRPLPYPHPERVVSFGHESPQWLTSVPEYLDYKRGLRAFESMAALLQGEGNLATEEDPERVAGAQVTPDFFTVLGLTPMLGRSFAPNEDLVTPANVVILSHGLWQRRFSG